MSENYASKKRREYREMLAKTYGDGKHINKDKVEDARKKFNQSIKEMEDAEDSLMLIMNRKLRETPFVKGLTETFTPKHYSNTLRNFGAGKKDGAYWWDGWHRDNPFSIEGRGNVNRSYTIRHPTKRVRMSKKNTKPVQSNKITKQKDRKLYKGKRGGVYYIKVRDGKRVKVYVKK